jgi:hypothetical protein
LPAELAVAEIEESGRSTIATTDLDSRVMKTMAGNRPAYNGRQLSIQNML